VCGPIASFAPVPTVCDAPPDGDCCSRSGAPVCPRAPEPGRCASCGASLCALGEAETVAAPARGAAFVVRDAAPAPARALARAAAAFFDAALAASPPRHLLFATFRN
jgi:hypothetical protein